MKIRFNCSAYNPKFGSVERGDVRELEEELAQRLIDEKVAEEVEELEEKTVMELRKMLSERDLSTKGKKNELIERLKNE